MRRWGLVFLILGLSAFLLPVLEPSLQSINSLGNVQPIIASLFAVIGALLVTFSLMRSNSF